MWKCLVEIEVLDLIERGLTSNEIAEKLGISWGTVRSHRGNIREKLGVTGPNGTLKWLWRVKNDEKGGVNEEYLHTLKSVK